jgi:hypothetical protein
MINAKQAKHRSQKSHEYVHAILLKIEDAIKERADAGFTDLDYFFPDKEIKKEVIERVRRSLQDLDYSCSLFAESGSKGIIINWDI